MSKEIYEVGHVLYTAPIAAETVTIVADIDIDDHAGYDAAAEEDGGDLTLAAIASRVVMPRNLVVTITDANASITGGYVTVFGIDANGEPVKEVFTAVGGTQTITGNVAFAQVTRAVVWGFTGTVTAADDNVKIGVGNKIGLPMGRNCVLLDVIKDLHNNVGIQIVPANIDRTYGTYTGTNAANADHNIELWYTFKRMLDW